MIYNQSQTKTKTMKTTHKIEAIGYAYEAGSFVSGLTLSVEQL